MASSLAAQLAKGISVNAPLLADRSRRKRAESYLFPSREADQHDLHSIYALGVTGLSKLKTLDAKFAQYDENLFSEAARGLDRTLQSVSQNAELDRALGSCLKDLGPYLLEAPASKALEWLVRRFRVNEFNLDDVMALFLPYHDTPHFAKMVSIMHIEGSGFWTFLAPTKAAGKPLPRSILVDEMLKNIDLARFVAALLPESLTARRPSRTLVGFTAGVTLDYLTRMKAVREDVLAFILPAVTRCFASDSNADCALAGYITLATLSQRCRLSSEALLVIMAEMIKGQRHIQPQQFPPLLVAVIGPQDELDPFSDSFTNSIMQLPGVAATLPDCLQWVGVEKLVLPLLPSLVNSVSEKRSFDTLELILRSPDTSSTIIERYTLLCLERISSGQTNPAFLQLVSVAYQRKDTSFSDVYARRIKEEENSDKHRILEKFLRSITLSPSSSGDRGGWIVSSHAADANDRVTAIKEILKALAVGDTGVDLYEALRSRIPDTNPKVAEALYSDARAVLPVFNDVQFIENVSKALPDVGRTAMRPHIAFIAEAFYGANMDLAPTIFERICLPFILFTKPRHKTAAIFWQTLRGTKLASYELLAGCMDIVFSQSEVEGAKQEDLRPIEELMTLNLTLVHKIAGNIVTSNSYRRHFDMILGLLKSSDAQTINVAYLLFRSLLNQLSGEHRVDAAYRILMAMGSQPLNALNDHFYDESNFENYISDDSLSKNIVSKPSSGGTLRRFQLAVLALLPVVQRPVGIKIDWLGDSSSASGKRFVELARALYTLANGSSSAQKLSTNILRALFVNLREETLLFLAGVWSTGAQSERDPEHLRLAALLHGTAFLKAQLADLEHPQDFQVILPSLLIAMQSEERSVRNAAMDCIGLLVQNSTPPMTSPAIYALDSAYGISSDGLQYLEQADFARYLSSLHSYRDHFINDSKYLGIFEQEMLCKDRSDSKKEAGYKYRVLCYTLSHAVVWTSLDARVALLNILRNVPNAAKLQMLLPLVQKVVSDNSANPLRDGEPDSIRGLYCQTLLESYDETTATDLNEPGSGAWITLERTLRFMFSDGAPASIRETIVKQLCSGLFHLLTLEHQLEICVILVDAAAVQADYHPLIKETLGVFSKNAALMTSLLAHFQPKATDTLQRAAKRVKTANDRENNSIELSLRPLTVLVEIMLANPLPGSAELMSCAIEVLTRVFHAYSSKSDANYLMQLLMAMLESLASSLAGNVTLSPGSVRMEILVELLRVSDNPQTFNQALLLIASLARLSPEFVMQNVMPVFTFMGSNVFHRDDSYSFRVVQKTVESIVPVMINTLKAKHTAPLDLQMASREFLRVFTDAATHVPRHRRTQFFNHLVEVLGPEEFTVSICLLLVDKAANRVVRQKPGDVANALGLPLIILQANFKATPFKVVEQLLHETTRLLLRITEPEGAAQDAFLESHVDSEHTASTSAKKQIQAILVFVDLVLQQSSRKGITSDESAVRESVRILLELSDLGRGSVSLPEFPDISRIALKTLGHLLRVISVIEFISSISTIIGLKNPTIESGAMNLLSSRLINVAPKTRQEISPIITSITEHVCGSLKESQDLPTLNADLKALSSIARTAVNEEMQGLNKAVPIVLQVATNQKSLTANVLACILPLSAAIGPRILPYFRGVVELCCEVLAQIGANGQQNRGEEDAQSVLVSLLSSLSQFWGNDELVRLTALTLDARPTPILLRKTLAKRIPAKQLLPALFRVWSNVAALEDAEGLSRQGAFFDLLKRVIRGSLREDIHEHLRQTFKLFLEAFDIVGKQEDSEDSESALLAAFVEVVTKLNEAAFKPLFRRLFDWAFNDTSDTSQYRQVTFCRVLTALIKLLKGLITPYMSTVLVPLTEKLESYCTDQSQSPRLWVSAVELLQCSVDLDEGAFWRTDKLKRLTPTLVAQIDVCPSLGVDSTRLALKTCLNTLVAAVDDDSLLKALNLQILMKTRSDDARVRVFALECAGHVWHGSGNKLIGFVSDVVTFIAECADDEHDDVAKEARKLKKTVESRCGSLDVLMQ